MDRPQGYLLSGGQSRRFGQDKARQRIGDRTLLEILQLGLSDWTPSVHIVAGQADRYADLGITSLSDRIPGQGPLSGIHAALVHVRDTARTPWAMVLSCDMTELRLQWLDELWRAAEGGSDHRAVVYEESASRRHPFPGCYHVSVLERIESQLQTGRRSCQALFNELGSELQTLPMPTDWPEIPQFNTPDEFAAWQRHNDN